MRRIQGKAACVLVAATLVAGCTDSPAPSKSSRQEGDETRGATETLSPSPQQLGPADERNQRRANPKGRVIESQAGGTITLPAAPEATGRAPQRGCVERGHPPVYAPPRPGLRAEIVEGAALVHYRFPKSIKECRPAFLAASISWSDGAAAPMTSNIPISKLSDAIRVRVRSDGTPPPDIVSVKAITASGRRGLPSTVRPR
jgi:hypothetical protein